MTYVTIFSVGDKMAFVGKTGGTWGAEGGQIMEIDIFDTGTGPAVTYTVRRDSNGTNIPRKEYLCFRTLADATAAATLLNA